MRSLFLDTNILIDFLAERQPFSKYAFEIFEKAEKKKVKLYTSSHSFATAHYILKKYFDEKALRESLHTLFDIITIVPVDNTIIKRSLLSKHNDFEDAIQIFAANTIDDLYCIVTRNLKDFKDADVSVLAPDELITHL